MDRIPSISRSRMQVERFNADNPVGKPVTYHAAPFRRVSTVTASKAHLIGNSPVVFVMGAGRVPLNRVHPQ
ncbi:hypothetical protein TSH7_25085 [Azospirillum sp. TSH7]|uniref:hypothetical protein n=1 Tax=unclassified Azospirillum TaxID=2630922 RepID=UPI000D622DDA|nr:MULTISPECIES: hypothetical protein [unclassified Azospirillum]PWC57823.1 hypothetical protein TSH7_25085 [Azospirillum sp. TSH7]PWC70242.1 hypothetical protein TSH20_07125 [Azospirillum sp. TSH20]